MTATGTTARLAALASEVERACALLVSPAPAHLDQCALILEDASEALAAIPAPEAAQSPVEVRRLAVSIRHAAALLDHAAEFHRNWRRIRGVMCSGYQPGGDAAEHPIPSSLSMEG